MPEFYSITKGQLFVGETLSAVQAKLKAAKLKGDVLHAKGWGEVDPEILRILIASQARKLIQIEPMSAEDRSIFMGLMGRDVDADESEAKPKKGKLKSKDSEDGAESKSKKPKAKKGKK
jgi:hypothetical protein